MMRNIIILTCNDLAIAFKNRSIYLIFFIPLFVFVTLQLVDEEGNGQTPLNIGIINTVIYPDRIVESMQAAEQLFTITRLADAEEGRRQLMAKKIDGVLLGSAESSGGVELLVLSKGSQVTLALVERISGLEAAVEGDRLRWLTAIRPLHDSGVQQQTLPTWILMLVLLVGCIIIPAQIAEEKEKKLLLGMLQTPVHEAEWLLAKLGLGMILILLAIIFLHLLGQFAVTNIFSYAAFIGLGSFCFTALGIFLGFICRSQASARTLGVMVYLPMLLPPALADFSRQLSTLAPLLPSYQFYEPTRAILLEGGKIASYPLEVLSLVLIGTLCLLFSSRLLKKRWLM
ncbi:ABC transporter permease [Desulfurivibrio sp. C05AmB]|jgi:ABC-2 type transport system permease protein|uniref:ABC transporter permease n=1 Tax=Desulfurivibrio sp. C05AmB TaxID=3374371 RepID=UPI00376EE593